MTERFQPPPPDVVAKLRAEAERSLSPEEFEAYVSAPGSDFEHQQNRSLIEWFKRRYPTPRERLAYARHMYAQWARSMPVSQP